MLLTPSGLSRRIKHHLYAQQHDFFASCTPHLELILSKEIQNLPGATITRIEHGGVNFRGDFFLLHDANLFLRSAHRILLRITQFHAHSYPELFNKMKRIPWERYVGFLPSVSMSVSAKKSRIRHTKHISESAFTAICEKMSSYSRTIEYNDLSTIVVYIRLFEDVCTVSIDTTGILLFKRGYKQNTINAPLRESIAAALLRVCDSTVWRTIIDPFCGSGSFIIEAALSCL